MNPLRVDIIKGQVLCFVLLSPKIEFLFNPACSVQEVQEGFLSG